MVVMATTFATVVVTAVGSVLCVVVVVMAVDLYDGACIYIYILRNGGTIQTRPILHSTTTTSHRVQCFVPSSDGLDLIRTTVVI